MIDVVAVLVLALGLQEDCYRLRCFVLLQFLLGRGHQRIYLSAALFVSSGVLVRPGYYKVFHLLLILGG